MKKEVKNEQLIEAISKATEAMAQSNTALVELMKADPEFRGTGRQEFVYAHRDIRWTLKKLSVQAWGEKKADKKGEEAAPAVEEAPPK